MIQYHDLIRRILASGADTPDRTGTGTRSIFGHQMRFDLEQGFPLVTTKRTFFRGAAEEMLWMLRGETNIRPLQERGVRIWDEWADHWGDLGPIYGAQWRDFNDEGYDQIVNLIEGLKKDPHSRRHIVSAWNPIDLPFPGRSPSDNARVGYMALAPCHCLMQFHVDPDLGLSCQLYQRSADVFLGVPFNIAGYALLTRLIAHHLDMPSHELIWTGGDCHLYRDHLEKAEMLLEREPRALPHLVMTHAAETPIWEVTTETLHLKGYDPHPGISAEVSV